MVFQFAQDQAFLISSCYVLPQFWHIFFSHILEFIPCVLYTLYIFNVIKKKNSSLGIFPSYTVAIPQKVGTKIIMIP